MTHCRRVRLHLPLDIIAVVCTGVLAVRGWSHGQITSSQRYTHVSIAWLHGLHVATHPAAKLDRRHDPDALSEEA